MIQNKDLYEAVKQLGVVDATALDSCYNDAQHDSKFFGDYLVERGLVSDEHVGELTAELLKLPFIQLSKHALPSDASRIIPESIAKKWGMIVWEITDISLSIAVCEIPPDTLLKNITQKTGRSITLKYATKRDIEQAMSIYKMQLQEELKRLSNLPNADAVAIVSVMIQYAYSANASDIHIEPEKSISVVRFRIDGILHEITHIPLTVHERLIARCKVLSRLKTDEHFKAQDGKMQFTLTDETIDIRVSVVPIVHGEKIVMRLLSSYLKTFGVSNLGLSPKDEKKVNAAFSKPFGMILSTGPTGSGKSTTMYAILKSLNTPERNIATIEDPVEYDIEGINQIQVNTATNLTFADGLRSILRQDPNIIYVGEIRDEETAAIAVNSAMTGHLVLSTLHTNNSATTIPRMLDMGIEPYLIASTVNVIIAQRLVRKICVACKMSYELAIKDISQSIPAEMLTELFGSSKTFTAYKGKGCPVCSNTGFSGRQGIFEVLALSPQIKSLIQNKASADDINKAALKEGMTSMLYDGLTKVRSGATNIDEVLRVLEG